MLGYPWDLGKQQKLTVRSQAVKYKPTDAITDTLGELAASLFVARLSAWPEDVANPEYSEDRYQEQFVSVGRGTLILLSLPWSSAPRRRTGEVTTSSIKSAARVP